MVNWRGFTIFCETSSLKVERLHIKHMLYVLCKTNCGVLQRQKNPNCFIVQILLNWIIFVNGLVVCGTQMWFVQLSGSVLVESHYFSLLILFASSTLRQWYDVLLTQLLPIWPTHPAMETQGRSGFISKCTVPC